MVTEAGLAARLGISRAEIRRVRDDLTPRWHWDRQGRTIVYTVEGEMAVCEAVGVSREEQPPQDAMEPETARVARIHRNRRILSATLDARTVVVRVRSSANFKLGMPIPVRRVHGDLYELTRACPRYPGRW